MSSFRARSRFAVIATAAPLMAGAIVTPAFAASVTVAPYTSIGANNVVGPNAGFRNVAHGVRGSTAVLTLDVSSASASLDRVDVRLGGFPTGPALVPDRDFSQSNGFAVFKDVSLNQDGTVGGPDGAFGVVDEAQGAVSTGYTVGTPSGGQYPVRIAIDGVRATNSARYFLTVKPSDAAGSVENRQFVVTVPAGGVRFGDATTSPASPVSTPTLTIDSKPPVAPAQTNFTPQPQKPFERQGATKVEDAYLVSKNEHNDPDKTLIFLNDGNNTAPANFLYRPVPNDADPLPAIAAPPANGGPIYIGDGTGITNTVKVARNNQTSDDVFVRAFDTIGNLTAAVRLFDNSQASSGDRVDRSNDVKAPVVAATAAALRTDPPAARGINAANVAAVPTKISYTVATANDARAHDRVNTIEARMVVSLGGIDSTDPANQTPWAALASTNPTATNAQNKEVLVNTTGVGVTGSQLRVEGRLLDDIGNTTDTWRSTGTFTKDLITPQVTGASFEHDDDGDGKGDPEDRVRVQFSEPMHKPSIAETGPTNPCTPEAPTNTSYCVNQVLPFPAEGIWWGSNPTVRWSADLTSVLITLGPEGSTDAMRLPEIGDKLRATDRVQDPVGNAAVVPTHSDRFISTPPPVPGTATTADTQGVGRNLYNQGRDGYLDKITVTFPVAIDNAAVAVPNNLANFTIVGSDVQTPSAVSVISSSQFTLSFGGVMGTGETPKVRYIPPATGGLTASTVPVPQFEKPTIDFAPPALQMLVTEDSNANGKLDRLVATYSEPVNHSNVSGDTAPNSYRVTGYENAPEPAVVACPAEGAILIDPYNTATQGATANVTHIAMCEKSGTAHNTAEIPGAKTVDYVPTDLSPREGGPNSSPTGWSSGSTANDFVFNKVLDKAPPVVVSRTTKDLNSDGRIDAIDIVYGELLDGLTVEGAQFIVSNRSVEAVERLNGTTVRLSLTPIAPGLVGDTDSKPTVQYVGGNATTGDGFITDASDQRNRVRTDSEPQQTSDGAGPAITGACAGTPSNNGKCPIDDATSDKINVFFSEVVDEASVVIGDIVVEQPAGANKAATAHTWAADDKSVTLTLANGAINPAQDATVRFPVANAVTDMASPTKNGNTQTASIVAPAPPAVALNLTCPIAATEGYCGATSVNTGAVSTAGLVRMWRLSTTARPTPTPDSEFSADQPSKYPPSGTLPEGTLKLFLSGKDDFGRLSPEVSDTIEILRAPLLSSVQFVNTTTARAGTWGRSDTVIDGDNVRVGATAFSSDVQKWVASNGACLAKHMSVNYKGLTGNAGHTAVAPFSCDLNTATAPDSRKMTFPFVKVAGTTKYPVGTVLRTSTTDPGWIIQDGHAGTQIRRQFISVGARRSHMIADSQVITGPAVVSILNGIPRGRNVGYRDGAVIKSATSGYFYMYQGVKRPTSGGLLAAWKMAPKHFYTVSQGELNAHPTGPGFSYGSHPLGTFVRFPDGSVNQITKNALGQVVRRNVTSSVALKTLLPLGQVYGANHYDRAVPFDASFTRGYRDGTLLKINANTYGVVSRTVLRTFANSTTFNTLGYNTANALPFVASYMPRTPLGYQTGAPIDRYKITTTVIKATNLAGGTATATVLPTLGGLYGVGNLDPIPAQWDRSRQ